MNVEKAYWFDWQECKTTVLAARRYYFGHETCQHLLPAPEEVRELAAKLKHCGAKATLVTPFLTNEGFDQACRLIDSLLEVLEDLEVVCGDWGLLHHLGHRRILQPIVGRLLVSHPTDPRIARMLESTQTSENSRLVSHLDGTTCLLKSKPPTEALRRHFSSCWIDRPAIIKFLKELGVHRCEISGTAFGLDLQGATDWSYSIHYSNAIIAVMRPCPGYGEDFDNPSDCDCRNENQGEINWRFQGIPLRFFRRANALYYDSEMSIESLDLQIIDRIVYDRRYKKKHRSQRD